MGLRVRFSKESSGSNPLTALETTHKTTSEHCFKVKDSTALRRGSTLLRLERPAFSALGVLSQKSKDLGSDLNCSTRFETTKTGSFECPPLGRSRRTNCTSSRRVEAFYHSLSFSSKSNRLIK